MTDDRITIETARLAKERGFNLLVKGSYSEYLIDQVDPDYLEGGGPFSMTKGEIERDDSWFKNGSNNGGDYSNENYTMYARPTQEELHKWLRDTYGVYVDVKPHKTEADELMWFSQVFTLRRYNMTYKMFEYITMFNRGDTYEEVMELGLREAVKLIKRED